MKNYRVTLKHECFYGFDVQAETEEEAKKLANQRMESGDKGREDFGSLDIFAIEEQS